MLSKTPNFDKALDEILRNLKPHQRKCQQCGGTFEIFQEDIDFYKKLRVPPPKLCPLCRKKRRFAHLMRVPKFFKKLCQAPGHREEVITVFPPTSPHKIFDFSYWYSDLWEAADFAKEYDFSKDFFSQFKTLFFDVPHIPLEHDPFAINSDYTVGGTGAKNVYYSGMGFRSENIMYCFDCRYCRDLVDCNTMTNSELCYNSIDSYNCNRCISIVECGECMDSTFLYNCKNCHHCFLSANLRNKSYVFRNQQLTKNDYDKKIATIDLNNRNIFKNYLQIFKTEIINKSLHRALKNINTYKSFGDGLKNCNKCYFVFRSENLENIRFGDNMVNTHDSMDVVNMAYSEQIYETVLNVRGSENKFSMYLRNCSYIEYSSECHNCHYCFGCVGLKNKEFHIFNRAFQESDYWNTVDRIKTKMLEAGEYREFFPVRLGLMPYQSSTAQKYFPLEKQEAERLGVSWYDEPEPNIPEGIELLTAPDDILVDINEVSDDIVGKAVMCELTKNPFRIIKSELDFYRRMKLPPPTKHPWQRMQERTQLERSIWLYPFKCPKCNKDSFTVYPPEKQKELKIYCEECYLKEVV
jgi:hypothetical protein